MTYHAPSGYVASEGLQQGQLGSLILQPSLRLYSQSAASFYHYNLDFNYVDSVELFARAYRSDPGWLDRMYYWNTYG